MEKTVSLLLLFVLLGVGCASDEPSRSARHADEAFYDFAWQRRPMVIFSPSLTDPRLERQLEIMRADKAGFAERDLTLVRAVGEEAEIVFPNREKFQRGAGARLRAKLGVEPTEFAVVVVGKDGNVAHRWSAPVSAPVLFAAIE